MSVQPIRLRIALLLSAILLFATNTIALGTVPTTIAAQSTPGPTPLLRATPTRLLRATATPQQVVTAQAVGLVTATATPPPTPTATATGERYAIDQQVTSPELPEIALAVRRATLAAEELILTVAFENQAEEPIRFSFITPVEPQRIGLIDSSGTRHAAVAVDEAWAAIQPEGGFATGGANLGTVTFARPIGPGPYRLTGIFDYPPIQFALTDPLAEDAAVAIPNGTYPVDTTLFSNDAVLELLRLNVRSVTLTAEEVTFAVAFVNTGYRQYGLRRGPTGMDATLLDADRRQFMPSGVSDTLAANVTPEEGIAPGAAYTGTITFPRPTALSDLRFTFTRYSPLTLDFGPDGLLASGLANTANGAPPPTPTPQPDVARYHALSALLRRQAEALLANQPDQFLQTMTPALQSTRGDAFRQLATMPLATLELTFAPNQDFADGVQEQLTGLLVTMRYTFAGVPVDNLFVQEFLAEFVRQSGNAAGVGWQMAALTPQTDLPFWWNGSVTSYETPHFLIFTRPNTTTTMEALTQEVEAAYATIGAQGLPLEERYVAYFTGPDEDFATYTGATNPDVLGVALSRYQIDAEAINVVSRAFYINGSNFVDPAQIEQRQSTITHELVHLALAADARPFTPPWLAEGLAVYYAEQDTAADRDQRYNEERLTGVDLTELTNLSSLGIHDTTSETTSYRYLYSGAVIAYLVETYGEAQLLAFYRSYAQVPAADIQERLPLYVSPSEQNRTFQALSLEVTQDALAANFGLTLEELDAAVKEWLLTQASR